jgi:YD repeat-containing protein
VYPLRLSAWDLAGRTGEIETTLVIDSAGKQAGPMTTDATVTLAGHTLDLARLSPLSPLSPLPLAGEGPGVRADGDFGNWTLPLLDTHLATDQPASEASGAQAPWRDGARVWLDVPMNLADADAGIAHLAFTLVVQDERLGSDAAAPWVSYPVFTSDLGWRLEAHNTENTAQADSLVRVGDRLYDQNTGLPWIPVNYTLTAPDGTRYALDAQGKVTRINFTDGQAWLVSDAGIVAEATAAGGTGERIDFQRDSQGRIVRILLPDGDALAYRYDSAGRLILVRRLDDTDLGTPIAYGTDGTPYTEALTAHFGAIVNWSAGNNTWQGMLQGEASFTFTVRESEMASTVHTPGGQGAVILALEAQLPEGATLEVAGGEIVGIATVAGKRTYLIRVTEAGVKLLRVQGTGEAQLRLTLAGDLNADGRIDGADSLLWDAQEPTADIDGNGLINAADRQMLYANTGFAANQAPVANDPLPIL